MTAKRSKVSSTWRATAICGCSSARDGPINFVDGEPFVKQNVFKSLDPKTGRPNVDPVRKPGDRQKGRFLPVAVGRQELAADRLQPEDADDLHPGERKSVRHLDRRKGQYTPGERFIGATTTLYVAPGADHIGEVQAWNLDTGKKVWSHPFANSQNWGPVLATGGGLVFTGGTNDR